MLFDFFTVEDKILLFLFSKHEGIKEEILAWINKQEHLLPVNNMYAFNMGVITMEENKMIKLLETPRMNEAGKYCLDKDPKARKVLFGFRPLSSDKEEKFGGIHYGLKYVPESEGDPRYAEGRWTEVGSKWSIEDRIISLNGVGASES